jgi:hypothetical protein
VHSIVEPPDTHSDSGIGRKTHQKNMAERQIIVSSTDGRWSAAYSDHPEERCFGATMQDAIDRLKRTDKNRADDLSAKLGNSSSQQGPVD